MIEGPGKKPVTFEQIFEENHPDRYGIHKDEYLRGAVTEGGAQNRQLYIHTALTPDGSGATALARRLERVKAAQIVATSIATEYGSAVAQNVLHEVHEKTNRKLWEEVTPGDLYLLRDELQLQLIKDDLAGNWASAAQEQYYPVLSHGKADVGGPSSKDGYYPIRGVGDAEVVGLRPLLYGHKGGPDNAIYEVNEEYSSIQWPDSDAKVGLRDVIHAGLIQRSKMQFEEKDGVLRLTQDKQGDSEENKRALTKFIGRHFEGVKPGHPAFPNIANNILSYLPRQGVTSTLEETAQKVAADVARKIAADTGRRVGAEPAEIDSDAVRRSFTLEMEEGNVVVGGNTNIPYRNVPGPIPPSELELQRQESFEIAGEHLRVDPTAFDAKANLLQAFRSDTVVPATANYRMLVLAGLTGTWLERFWAALQQRSTRDDEKMTDYDSQIALGEIFETKIDDRGRQEGVHLAPEHFAALRAQWRNDPPEAFAFRLLCMAALYTNYASSYVFGNEYESPNAPLTYAEALLRKAHELDPGLLPDNQLEDWVNRLSGKGNAFQCTSVLYGMQSRHLGAVLNQEAGNGPLHQVRDDMIPLAWR